MRTPKHIARKRQREIAVGREQLHAAGQHRARICDGKGRFPSKAVAKEYAAVNTRRYGKPTFVYECRVCLQWHLTTQRPEEHRARLRLAEGIASHDEE